MTILLCAVLSNQVSVVIFMSVSLSLSFSYVPEGLNLRNGGGLMLLTTSGSFSKRKVFTLLLWWSVYKLALGELIFICWKLWCWHFVLIVWILACSACQLPLQSVFCLTSGLWIKMIKKCGKLHFDTIKNSLCFVHSFCSLIVLN